MSRLRLVVSFQPRDEHAEPHLVVFDILRANGPTDRAFIIGIIPAVLPLIGLANHTFSEDNIVVEFFAPAPPASIAATEAEIRSLVTVVVDESSIFRYDEHEISTDAERQTLCSVCHDVFLLGQEVSSMPCAHVFHKDCIITWLQHKNSCPNCRAPLVAREAETSVAADSIADSAAASQAAPVSENGTSA